MGNVLYICLTAFVINDDKTFRCSSLVEILLAFFAALHSHFIMLGGYFGYSANTNTSLSIFEFATFECVDAYVCVQEMIYMYFEAGLAE